MYGFSGLLLLARSYTISRLHGRQRCKVYQVRSLPSPPDVRRLLIHDLANEPSIFVFLSLFLILISFFKITLSYLLGCHSGCSKLAT